MKITVHTDKVLVLPDEVDQTLESGLVVVSKREKKTPTTGIAVSVGKGDLHPMEDIQEGQRVYFKPYAGTDVTFEGVEYYVLHYNDVLAVSDVN